METPDSVLKRRQQAYSRPTGRPFTVETFEGFVDGLWSKLLERGLYKDDIGPLIQGYLALCKF